MEFAEKKWKKEGLVEGEQKGLIKGKIEGEQKKAVETARKMKQDGLSAEVIAKYTNLSIEEIEKL